MTDISVTTGASLDMCFGMSFFPATRTRARCRIAACLTADPKPKSCARAAAHLLP
jgi:hypothetical protein